MTPEEFRRAGHDLIDWIADFRTTLESRPVMARTSPGEVARAFATVPPDAPQPIEDIFTALDAAIVPGLTHFAATGEGLQGGGSPLVVYASGQSHSSVLKAALVAGFGRTYVREIATGADHAMRPEALDRAMREDHARGWTPCAVVATSGST